MRPPTATGASRPTPERRRGGARLIPRPELSGLEPGTRLADRYRLERRLGRRGHVWLARDSEGGERALKFGPRALVAHEHRILAGIAHPAIVRSYGWHDGTDGSFLVLDYLPGGDLTGLAGGPPERWRQPVLELIGGLEHLHAAGLVHRDLKARNVLLDADDHARLVDFASALPVGHAWTDAGTTATTLAHDRGGAPVGPADDVYALTVLLYELIHGCPPGAGAAPAGLVTPALAACVEAGLESREAAATTGLRGLRTVIESEA